MALTNAEEKKVKELIAEKVKEEAIIEINRIAFEEINDLKSQIQTREDKRIADIKKL